MSHRCGAPTTSRDPRKKHTTCRVLVREDGDRCRHHQERKVFG